MAQSVEDGSPKYSHILNPSKERNVEANPIAERLDTLEGITLGVLDDNLANADIFLDEVVNRLKEEYEFADVIMFTKEDLSLPAAEWMKSTLESKCDAVLVGVGDCGSCTSQCVYDAIDFEQRGIPTALFVTTEFASLGRFETESFGMPTIPIVSPEYPLAYGVSEDAARSRADGLIPEVVHVLTTPREELEAEYSGKYADEEDAKRKSRFVCEF